MRRRSSFALAFVLIFGTACGATIDADDTDGTPSVTVLGTSVDSGQTEPSLGIPVTVER